ncbi:MAG TPA: MHYT domain-containing protein [Gemmatimonadales bacterium]
MTPLPSSYDLRLVAVSIVIAVLASGAALDLAARATAAHRRMRAFWLAGGAFAMGLGIWSMHYTGMLAHELSVSVRYHVPTVALSLLAAVAASAVALYVASSTQLARGRLLTGSGVMGAGIAAMHYVGMAAMRLPAIVQWSAALVSASVLIAIAVSAVALRLAFHHGHQATDDWTPRKIGSAVVMGLAIPSMHYTGMAAATFLDAPGPVALTATVSVSALGTAGIAVTTLVVLGLAVGTSVIARHGEVQLRLAADRLRDRERQLVEAQAIAHVGHWELELGSNQVTWSDELYRICGVPIGAPAGYTEFLALVHPEDRERVARITGEGLAEGRSVEFDWRALRPNGEVRYLHSRNIVVTDAAGRPVRAAGTCLDITERKRAEENQQTLTRELTAAVQEVKVLEGILPICASCKRIRTNGDTWEAVESYVRQRTNAEFSHGLCPDCAVKTWGVPG